MLFYPFWLVLLFLLAAFLHSSGTIVVSQDIKPSNSYQWKTGPWTACGKQAACGEGYRNRTITCTDTFGNVVPSLNCRAFIRPTDLEKCFTVCDHHKFVLRWKVGHWSRCKSNHSPQCNGSSVTGTAHRSVECVLSSTNLIVDDEACKHFWDKPVSEMLCSADCPQECVTAKTNITCKVNEGLDIISWKTEAIDMLVAPSNDVDGCRSLSTQPLCQKHRFSSAFKSPEQQKDIYKVKIGSWSACMPENGHDPQENRHLTFYLRPILGWSKRDISCVNENGVEVNMSFCHLNSQPILLRRCVVSTHCVVSPWSDWIVKGEGCIASDGIVYPRTIFRKRQLLQLPVGVEANPCPPLYEERTISVGLPPCNKYKWYKHPWSDCQLSMHGPHQEISIIKPTCGHGVRYRNITCLRASDMVPVAVEFCKDPPPKTVSRCKIRCKDDCEVSHWTYWGPCFPFNSKDVLKRWKFGYRKRKRSVIVNPSGDGKACPHLEEIDMCPKDWINIYNWKYGKWKDCELDDPGATCGEGKRNRDFSCVKYDGAVINNFLCDHHIILMDLDQPCRIPCPNDCIMTEWSPWSECNAPCLHKKQKPIQKRNRTVLAIPGEDGHPCRNRTQMVRDCNQNSCHLYRYRITEWGPCIPVARRGSHHPSCGKGIQKREAHCPPTNETKAAYSKLCNLLTEPELVQECNIPCPVDCVMSNFTDWTPCEDTCTANQIQYRHRIVLQPPQHGGRACPEARIEARPCPYDPNCLKNGKEDPLYQWETSPWSSCFFSTKNQTCGIGFQIRNVSCVDGFHRAVEPHFCLPHNWTHLPDRPIDDLPSAMRSCEIACSSGCALSTWSPWSECVIYSYNAKRTRKRELVGDSQSKTECIGKFKLFEDQLCPTLPAQLQSSEDDNWMSCIVQEENKTEIAVNGQLVNYSCGDGYRYRFGLQMDSASIVKPGLEKLFCVTDCPVDCQMSDWSEWTECNVPCGQGFRERQRQVLVHSNALGRPCPVNKTEIQRDVCSVNCQDYEWLALGWTKCELEDPEAKCGNGTHYRTVRCLDKRTEQEVEESRCDPFEKPPTFEPCVIYCPGECVVSPWGIAKKCSEPCSADNYQEMVRTILRQPNSTAEPCPDLTKKVPCVLNSNCHNHTWNLGPWASCVLPKGAYCGKGIQKRPQICLRSDLRQVDPMHCEKTQKPPSLTENISKPCYIDCPEDCVMSEWSAWNRSSCSACGAIGVMTRTRQILQSPTDSGQPCSSETTQRMPCDFRPCYHWRKSEWSRCDLEGADCGFGVRRRVVECFRSDNLKVDRSHCFIVNVTFPVNGWIDPQWLASAQDSHEEEICHVPCPGDCIMSEWSDWKHCQKNCTAGQKVGYRTSSRHVLFLGKHSSTNSCPTQLWRTKPCWSDDCDVFAWKLKNNSYICETKDGAVVQGGCTFAPRPCFSTCEAIGGRCRTSTGVCYCENAKGEETILGPSSGWCGMMGGGPRPPAGHSAPIPEIKYYPDDNQVSFWMYAMISIGTAFVIFVAVTVYLMCRSSLRQRTISVERQPSVRRRQNDVTVNSAVETTPETRPRNPNH